MANSNTKETRKLQAAKKEKANEKAKTVKKVKAVEEKPIKYTVTAKKQADGTFKFCGGKGGFNITKQKNKALEPYGKCIHNYGVLLELIPGDKQAAINQQIGNARVVHNDYLSKREEYYKETKKALTVSQYKKEYLKTHPDINFFIFGHRHIMLDLMLSRTARLLIAGDWMQYFSYIVWDGKTLYMEQFETE